MSVVGIRPVSSASYSSSAAEVPSSTSTERPNLSRRETDQILSYYQSEDAGRTYMADEANDVNSLRRRSTSSSSTSSIYSLPEPLNDNPSPKDDPFIFSSPATASPLQRRMSARSSGGSDKRRMAIVEMDSAAFDEYGDVAQVTTFSDVGHATHSALLSRRGLDGYRMAGLALIAPPDTSPSLCFNLTPPLSAPAVERLPSNESTSSSSSSGHQRSHSEAVKVGYSRMRKSSRDIGIVGMNLSPIKPYSTDGRDDPSGIASRSRGAEVSPIFQTSSSLARTSLLKSDAADSDSRIEQISLAASLSSDMPNAGSQQQYHASYAANETSERIAHDLSNGQLWQSASSQHCMLHEGATSPYPPSPSVISSLLYYQPGLHATAGPLPSPPRQIVPPLSNQPPPRPPRLDSPTPAVKLTLKQRLQLPERVSSVLSKRIAVSPGDNHRDSEYSNASSERTVTADSHLLHHEPSRSLSRLSDTPVADHKRLSHAREGGFPVTPILITHSSLAQSTPNELRHRSDTSNAETAADSSTDGWHNADVSVQSSTAVEQSFEAPTHALPTRRSGLDLRREASWIDFKAPQARTPESEIDQASIVSKPLPELVSAPLPIPAPDPGDASAKREDHPHMRLLDIGAKRFSALPKAPSKASMSNGSGSSHSALGHTSPRYITLLKVKSTWPESMAFVDVISKKYALERALCYATKINDLARHDSGLSDWVIATKSALMHPRGVGKRCSYAPDGRLDTRPRHSSRASISSEVTFPRRLDAYVATDLSMRPSEEEIPEGPPPSLPYPVLAQGARVPPSRTFGGLSASSSTRSIPTTLSNAKSIGGGFFASIGRKASIRRQQSTVSSLPPPQKLLGRLPPTTQPTPRAIHITAAPMMPGGPRAPPGRVQRSRSTIAHSPKNEDLMITPAQQQHSPQPRRVSLRRSSSVAPSTRTASLNEQEFERQLNKLADLLPSADRAVLAGYLRRAGQDMLAIGHYLEDERKGTIRRD